MGDETVLLRVDAGIAEIIFNRPEKRNAFVPMMYQRFVDIMRSVRTNPGVGILVLYGNGKDFCAGNDLQDFASKAVWDPEELADRTRTASTEIVHQLLECEKPVIAAVHGNAAGFGATMLLHCDVVILEEDARLHFPFVKLGMVPEAGATRLCTERMGYLRAFDLFTRNNPVSAPEALELNLASRIVKKNQARKYAIDEATRLNTLPNDAMIATKRLMRSEIRSLSQHVSSEFEELARRLTG